MTTTKILRSLLIAALLASASASAADNSNQVPTEDGKTMARFKIGDSRCVLVGVQIRCALSK